MVTITSIMNDSASTGTKPYNLKIFAVSGASLKKLHFGDDVCDVNFCFCYDPSLVAENHGVKMALFLERILSCQTSTETEGS